MIVARQFTAWECENRDRLAGTCRAFAAKRLHIIAQGFSPGLRVTRNPPWRPRRVFRLFACYSTAAPNIGCHFSSFVPYSPNYGGQAGHLLLPPDPGLKPWAVMYSRFAAKSDGSLTDRALS